MPDARKPSSRKPSTRKAASPKPPSLAQLVRHSPALDATARRHWLAVLPHLTLDDQTHLREILAATAASDAPQAAEAPPPFPQAGEGVEG
jgi:hypothetical protein